MAGLTLAPQAFYFSVAPHGEGIKFPTLTFSSLVFARKATREEVIHHTSFSVLGFTHRTSRWNRQRRVSKNFERAQHSAVSRSQRRYAFLISLQYSIERAQS